MILLIPLVYKENFDSVMRGSNEVLVLGSDKLKGVHYYRDVCKWLNTNNEHTNIVPSGKLQDITSLSLDSDCTRFISDICILAWERCENNIHVLFWCNNILCECMSPLFGVVGSLIPVIDGVNKLPVFTDRGGKLLRGIYTGLDKSINWSYGVNRTDVLRRLL